MKRPKNKADILVTIDASGKALGRVCSEAAVALRGKILPSFKPNQLPKVDVVIKNIDEIRFTGGKLDNRIYHRFSGYPGGLKDSTLRQEFERHPERVVRQSVQHMLPKNRLASRMIQRLTVYRGEN